MQSGYFSVTSDNGNLSKKSTQIRNKSLVPFAYPDHNPIELLPFCIQGPISWGCRFSLHGRSLRIWPELSWPEGDASKAGLLRWKVHLRLGSSTNFRRRKASNFPFWTRSTGRKERKWALIEAPRPSTLVPRPCRQVANIVSVRKTFRPQWSCLFNPIALPQIMSRISAVENFSSGEQNFYSIIELCVG